MYPFRNNTFILSSQILKLHFHRRSTDPQSLPSSHTTLPVRADPSLVWQHNRYPARNQSIVQSKCPWPPRLLNTRMFAQGGWRWSWIIYTTQSISRKGRGTILSNLDQSRLFFSMTDVIRDTLQCSKNTSRVKCIYVNVFLIIEVQVLLDTAHGTNKGRLSCVVLNRHWTIDCSSTLISSTFQLVPGSNIDNTSLTSLPELWKQFVH